MTESEQEAGRPGQSRAKATGAGTPARPRSQSARAQEKARQTPHAQRERKHRVLAKGHPAMVDSIAGAITIKSLDLYYVIAADAQIPVTDGHGFGLYFHDCRFIGGYEMTLAGLAPVVLASTAQKGYAALFELTNPDLRSSKGRLIPKDEHGIRWERILDAGQACVREVLAIQNLGHEAHDFALTLQFGAGFEDIFNVRGLVR